MADNIQDNAWIDGIVIGDVYVTEFVEPSKESKCLVCIITYNLMCSFCGKYKVYAYNRRLRIYDLRPWPPTSKIGQPAWVLVRNIDTNKHGQGVVHNTLAGFAFSFCFAIGVESTNFPYMPCSKNAERMWNTGKYIVFLWHSRSFVDNFVLPFIFLLVTI